MDWFVRRHCFVSVFIKEAFFSRYRATALIDLSCKKNKNMFKMLAAMLRSTGNQLGRLSIMTSNIGTSAAARVDKNSRRKILLLSCCLTQFVILASTFIHNNILALCFGQIQSLISARNDLFKGFPT